MTSSAHIDVRNAYFDGYGDYANRIDSPPGASPLYRSALAAAHRLVSASIGSVAEIADSDRKQRERDEERMKRWHYPYIALSPERFLNILMRLEKWLGFDHIRNAAFVDVGCGGGDKVVLAKHAGFKSVAGIEYAELTARKAKSAVPEADIIVGDALDARYRGYGVIYMYMPMYNEESQARLFNTAYNRAAPGAVLVEAYPMYLHELKRKYKKWRILTNCFRYQEFAVQKTAAGPMVLSDADDTPWRLEQSGVLTAISAAVDNL